MIPVQESCMSPYMSVEHSACRLEKVVHHHVTQVTLPFALVC